MEFTDEGIAAGITAAIDDMNAGHDAEQLATRALAYLTAQGSLNLQLLAGYVAVLAFGAGKKPIAEAAAFMKPLTKPAAQMERARIEKKRKDAVAGS